MSAKNYSVRELAHRMKSEPDVLLLELKELHSQLKIARDLLITKSKNLNAIITLTNEIAARQRRTRTQVDALEEYLINIASDENNVCDLTQIILAMPEL